jgi:hypothetical protein
MMHYFDRKLVFQLLFVQNVYKRKCWWKNIHPSPFKHFTSFCTKIMLRVMYEIVPCYFLFMHVSVLWNNTYFLNIKILCRICKGSFVKCNTVFAGTLFWVLSVAVPYIYRWPVFGLICRWIFIDTVAGHLQFSSENNNRKLTPVW